MLSLSEPGRKGTAMTRYFMTGTKYEKFERMMMSSDRSAKDPPAAQPAPELWQEYQRAKKISVDFYGILWYVFVLSKRGR